MNASVPSPALVDLLRLWRVDPRGHVEELVREINASDIDVVITGEESFSELARVVTDVEESLGVAQMTGSALQDEAVAAMCRRLATGTVSPRELTYWVTRVIGWRGSARTQALLDLEQDYCAMPLADEEVAALDARVGASASAFLVEPAAVEVSPRLRRVRRLLRRPGPGGQTR